MPDVTDPDVDRPVVAGDEAFVWSMEFLADDASFAGATGVTWDPVARLRRYHLHLFTPDGVVVVRDDDVAPPSRGRVCDGRSDALWFSYSCETPLDHWSCSVEAFGVFAPDGDELVQTDRRAGPAFEEVGERVAVGIDIDFDADTQGRAQEVAGGFVQRGRVRGDLLVGTDVYPVDLRATRRVVRGAARDVAQTVASVSPLSSFDESSLRRGVWQRVNAVPVPVVRTDGSRELWRRVLLRLASDHDGGAGACFRFDPAGTID